MENVHALFDEGPMDFGDEPSPPSKEEIDLEADVFIVCSYLGHARGDDVPEQMAMALGLLRSHAQQRKDPRPSIEQRDRILDGIAKARFSVMKFLEDAGRDERNGKWGLDAARGLAIFWAENDAERAARHPDVLYDLRDHAEILRNDFRNAQIERDIQARAFKRQADMVTAACPMHAEHIA